MVSLEFPLHGKQRRPILQTTTRFLDGPEGKFGMPRRIDFILDTGSDATLIGKSVWGLLRVLPKPIGPPKPVSGVGGGITATPVGPVRISVEAEDDVLVFNLPKAFLLNSAPKQTTANLLGRDFMEAFVATAEFDFPKGLVSLDFQTVTATFPKHGFEGAGTGQG